MFRQTLLANCNRPIKLISKAYKDIMRLLKKYERKLALLSFNKVDRVALLLTDPCCAKSTALKDSPILKATILYSLTFELTSNFIIVHKICLYSSSATLCLQIL